MPLFACLFDETARVRVLGRLRDLEPDAPRRWGRMTAPQMVCHLADAFRGAIGDMPLAEAAVPMPRWLFKLIALRVPRHWPPGVAAPREIRQELGGTPPGDFESDVERLVALMDRFVDARPQLARVKHPMFGTMTAWDWGRWGYLHMDHHLRQFGC